MNDSIAITTDPRDFDRLGVDFEAMFEYFKGIGKPISELWHDGLLELQILDPDPGALILPRPRQEDTDVISWIMPRNIDFHALYEALFQRGLDLSVVFADGIRLIIDPYHPRIFDRVEPNPNPSALYCVLLPSGVDLAALGEAMEAKGLSVSSVFRSGLDVLGGPYFVSTAAYNALQGLPEPPPEVDPQLAMPI